MQLSAEVLVVAVTIFIIAQLARVPLSLSMSLVGLLAGVSIAGVLDGQLGYMTKVVAMWFIAPVAAGILAFTLIRYLNSRKPKNIWQNIRLYKVMLIVLAFTAAYTLGANTLGLIVATAGFSWTTVAVGVAAIFIGTFFLGEGAIRRVGEEFYLMRYSNATVALAASTILS